MAFTRPELRHPFTIRHLEVARTTPVTPRIVRVTLTGPELDGFQSTGPNDHLKIFFPDPQGVIVAPVITADGPRLPDGAPPISRDYTPRQHRPAHGGHPAELDIDFVIHGEDGRDGPASAWAATTQPGAQLVIAGPRGSRGVPEGIDNVILIADETALPALTRWIAALPPKVTIWVILRVADPSATDYLTDAEHDRISHLTVTSHDDDDEVLLDALTALEPVTPTTFVFGAGEATSLVPVRTRLRKQLNLPREQVTLSGYWKRGTAGLDHHAPLDPTDPD